MHRVFALLLMVWLALPGFAATRKRHSATATHSRHSLTRQSSSWRTSKAAASKKTTASKKASRSSTRGRHAKYTTAKGRKHTKARPVRQTWRTRQLAPSPERYQEIQKALIAKGYGSQEADGVWGPHWVEALKRFQHDQNLEPTGKLTSLSLITLGLGPKRETNGSGGVPAAPAQAPGTETPAVRPANPPPPASSNPLHENLK